MSNRITRVYEHIPSFLARSKAELEKGLPALAAIVAKVLLNPCKLISNPTLLTNLFVVRVESLKS